MERPRLFLSAGEPSGDLLAGELALAMRRQIPDIEIFGICGPKMREAGVEALFGIEDLSVMGFVEVLKHLPFLKQLEFSLIETLEKRQPCCAVLVDYPGFHMRLADELKLRNIPVIQYVAPQLWAWGEKRTKTLKAVTDLVLGIMPFEDGFFRERGVNYRYVGTPQVDRALHARRDRARYGLDERTTIGFFPGSRRGEVSRLLPRMLLIREELRKRSKELRFTISAAPNLPIDFFEQLLGEGQGDILFESPEVLVKRFGDTVVVRGESIHLMKSCESALVTSGTATLECALVETPMAVAYVMQGLSFQIAKHFVKLPYISLVNLVADRPLIPEFIQNFGAVDVAVTLHELAAEGPIRAQQSAGLRELHGRLLGDLAEHAATAIMPYLQQNSPR